jgi:hypothetical protein
MSRDFQFLLSLTFVGLLAVAAVARTWTDATGRYQVEGELVRYEDRWVQLRKPDGMLVPIHVDRLCAADRSFVARWIIANKKPSPSRESQNREPGTSQPSRNPTRSGSRRFAVTVRGTELVHNDGSGRRFFALGLVDNRPASGKQLSRYDHGEMEEQLASHARMGANAMRWNTFLKGCDLRWDAPGHVCGMSDGAVANIVDGLNLAQKHGVMIQLTLSTGHFLQYGWGGKTQENARRVENNKLMFENEAATDAYLRHVIQPLTEAIGSHPALLGYLIVNEVNAMIDPRDTPNGSWSDAHVRLRDMQRWVNRVAGAIHQRQPGVLVTVSTIAKLLPMLSDEALIAAGGDKNGTLDWYQIQFYPKTHIEDWSPFERTASDLLKTFARGQKPVFCGEFPVEGMIDRANKKRTSAPFGLNTAYERLWNNGHSGGFTWSYNVYVGMDRAEKKTVEDAYRNFRNQHAKHF